MYEKIIQRSRAVRTGAGTRSVLLDRLYPLPGYIHPPRWIAKARLARAEAETTYSMSAGLGR
jgi:hypothetical protein